MATKTMAKKKTARAVTKKAATATRTVTKKAAPATRAVRKSARTAAKSPMGKAAVKVLAGATAGAVRAIIPQLEEAADAQEQVVGSPRPSGRGKTRKTGASA